MKTNKMENIENEPIIWTIENGPLEDFLQVARGIGKEYIIYVRDVDGERDSVWASTKEGLIECIITFSDRLYFGRVQSIDIAINYGYFGIADETFLN